MPGAWFGFVWKTLVGAFTFAAGLVVSRLAIAYLGLSPERAPNQASEVVAGYYLLAGSIALAIGTVPSALGLREGRTVGRSLVLAVFLVLGLAVSTSIEASIYSSAAGALQMIPVLILPCLLLAVAEAALFGSRSGAFTAKLPERVDRTAAQWTFRGLGAVLAFPLVYFVFGTLVSPIVGPFYARGIAGLALPGVGTIVGVEVLRGVLHLAAIGPILLLWGGTRKRLIFALASGFFVFVAAYDPILAYEVPVRLIVVHGIEVALDSVAYAWLVVSLLGLPRATADLGIFTGDLA